MKSYTLFSLLLLLELIVIAQSKPLMVYDMQSGSLDSIPTPFFDSTRFEDQTTFYLGNHNQFIQPLETNAPTINLQPGGLFTYKTPAIKDMDLEQYPLRTSVKLFEVDHDTLAHNCSGSLISRKHVLTAAHCLLHFTTHEVKIDSMIAVPAFNYGEGNEHLGYSPITKVFFIKNWTMQGEDIAVLELQHPIGENAGWISIGYNKVDSVLRSGLYYKFSYPSLTNLWLDSNTYNGDTLYYSYGKIDQISPKYLAISGSTGIPGESGSSLIKTENKTQYTSYGVLSFSNNLNHSRINQWQFYSFKNIIDDEVSISPPIVQNGTIIFFPNPVRRNLYILNESGEKISEISMYNSIGKRIKMIDPNQIVSGIDLSDLSSGTYFLRLNTTNSSLSKTIIKIED